MEPKKQNGNTKEESKKHVFVKTLRQIYDRYIIACLIATRSRDRTRASKICYGVGDLLQIE